MNEISVLAANARTASLNLQSATAADKSLALSAILKQLTIDKNHILDANRRDMEIAEKQSNDGLLLQSLVKRLDLNIPGKWELLLQGIQQVDNLPDPTNKIQLATQLDVGLDLYKVSCPIGVLLVIFEARPEVIVQISCLAIKSGNAVILKGGKEAQYTNDALNLSIRNALDYISESIPKDSVQLVSSRDEIASLLKLDKFIDLVIPRGSNSLVKYIKENTRIPVLGHADGLCSIYVDESADVLKAIDLIVDSKTNYPAACNSTESLLINRNCAHSLLPQIAIGLQKHNVLIKADLESFTILSEIIDKSKLVISIDEDFDTEFLDYVIAIKIVSSLNEAIEHINTHGSKHTDMIITEVKDNAERFMRLVDSAGVYWNASTRFADGFRYGFGAEVGVSTNKIHARGPVGLEGLVIYKYKLYGNGQIAGSYGPGKKSFTHVNLL